MHIQDHIIAEIAKGNTPAIKRHLYERIYFHEGVIMKRHGMMMITPSRRFFHVETTHETIYTKVGRTYKVQRIGKRSGMGLSLKVTSIEDKGDHALIHYEMIGDE